MKLPDLSEGVCFDFLAILEVKYNKNSKSQNQDNFYNCVRCFRDQLGDEYDVIVNSKEYHNLYDKNSDIFEFIEGIRGGREATALEFDILNDKRTLAKKRLQKKFFPNTKNTEVKTNE